VILSRYITKACRVPRELFDVLEKHGGAIGALITSSQRQSLVGLWREASAPVGDPARRSLPARCDREWFEKTFCGGRTTTTEDSVWGAIESINVYSPIALIAALPGDTFENYLQSVNVNVRSACHAVVGLTNNSRSVKNMYELRFLLVQSFFSASLVNASKFNLEPPTAVSVAFEDDDTASEDEKRTGAVWAFTDIERKRLYDRTVGKACKNVLSRQNTGTGSLRRKSLRVL